jgi:hypothetical protein
MKKLFTVALVLFYPLSFAQLLERVTYPVFYNSKKLELPFLGGLNSPQFYNVDYDNDGKDELLIFERTSNRIYLLKKLTTENTFTPLYHAIHNFPKLNHWMILVDFNGDNLKDIFTHSPLGIKVYRASQNGSKISFHLEKEPLVSKGFSSFVNILVNSKDIPAIVDWDNDGDLDILNFNFFNGSRIEYHQNQSIEQYGSPDSLIFLRKDDCFGGFEEITCDIYKFGLNCHTNLRETNYLKRLEHVGSGALFIADIDYDGKKDILVAKEDCDKITWLKNRSDSKNGAHFTMIEGNFPIENPFIYKWYPFVFEIDIHDNGKKNLIFTTNLSDNSNRVSNFKESVFILDSNKNFIPFLQKDMIDIGENAAPCIFDIDEDGDLDLIIASKGRIENEIPKAEIWWFENINNEFVLKTKNLFEFNKTRLLNLIPQFIDYDNDNYIDLMLTVTDFDNFGKTYVLFFRNNGIKFSDRILNLSDGIEINLPLNQEDIPHFIDINADGKTDALVGKSGGALVAYINNGNSFNLHSSSFLNLANQIDKQRLSVFSTLFDENDIPDLLIAYDNGELGVIYDFIDNTRNAKVEKIYERILNSNFTIPIGKRPILYANKGLLAVGNCAGGIELFKFDYKGYNPQLFSIAILPSINDGNFTIESSAPYYFYLYDATGKLAFKNSIISSYPKTSFAFSLPKGLYIGVFEDLFYQKRLAKKIVIF